MDLETGVHNLSTDTIQLLGNWFDRVGHLLVLLVSWWFHSITADGGQEGEGDVAGHGGGDVSGEGEEDEEEDELATGHAQSVHEVRVGVAEVGEDVGAVQGRDGDE